MADAQTSRAASHERPKSSRSASQAFEAGERRQRHDQRVARRWVEDSEFGAIHQFQPLDIGAANGEHARPEIGKLLLDRLAVRIRHERQPFLASQARMWTVGADAGGAVTLDIASARPRPGRAASHRRRWRGSAHRGRRNARRWSGPNRPPGRDRRRRRHAPMLPQQRKIGLDDQLAGAFAAQAPSIEPDGRGLAASDGICLLRRHCLALQREAMHPEFRPAERLGHLLLSHSGARSGWLADSRHHAAALDNRFEEQALHRRRRGRHPRGRSSRPILDVIDKADLHAYRKLFDGARGETSMGAENVLAMGVRMRTSRRPTRPARSPSWYSEDKVATVSARPRHAGRRQAGRCASSTEVGPARTGS